jgi:hypothetical protein
MNVPCILMLLYHLAEVGKHAGLCGHKKFYLFREWVNYNSLMRFLWLK